MINYVEKVAVPLLCVRCHNTFQYKGSGIYSTRCPRCHGLVSLRGIRR